MTSNQASLVILYHREPLDEVIENGQVFYREKKKPNGIIPTLKSFFLNAERGTWIAWKQVEAGQQINFKERIALEGANENCAIRRIPLSADEVKDFYHITSKEAFWPILHSFPSQFTYSSANWENFKAINQQFANAACEEAAEDALIWVHDYNLWLAPYYVRQKMPKARIAFFHHTPFPSADIFGILPWRQAIVDSLLACDLCGFHIPRYVENFVAAASSVRDVEVLERSEVNEAFTKTGVALASPRMATRISYRGREVRLDAFPVGTNPAYIRDIVAKSSTKETIAKLRSEIGDRKLILSAGRIDYVKGTREMLLSYERLLDRRPELRGKVILVNIAAAAAKGMRVYRDYQQEIESLVGRINGRFSTLTWTPILLFTQTFTYEQMVAYFQAADIVMVPPLRDGLNLVAKEYISAHEGGGGVLILSEFTGASVELPEAIQVNPFADSSMDDALDVALAMPEDEQRRRMEALNRAVNLYDVQQWANHMFREAMACEPQEIIPDSSDRGSGDKDLALV